MFLNLEFKVRTLKESLEESGPLPSWNGEDLLSLVWPIRGMTMLFYVPTGIF